MVRVMTFPAPVSTSISCLSCGGRGEREMLRHIPIMWGSPHLPGQQHPHGLQVHNLHPKNPVPTAGLPSLRAVVPRGQEWVHGCARTFMPMTF